MTKASIKARDVSLELTALKPHSGVSSLSQQLELKHKYSHVRILRTAFKVRSKGIVTFQIEAKMWEEVISVAALVITNVTSI